MELHDSSMINNAAPVRAAEHIPVPSATEAHCCMPFRSHAAPRDPHENDEDESSRIESTESMSMSDLRLGDASHPSENKFSDEPYQDRSHSSAPPTQFLGGLRRPPALILGSLSLQRYVRLT